MSLPLWNNVSLTAQILQEFRTYGSDPWIIAREIHYGGDCYLNGARLALSLYLKPDQWFVENMTEEVWECLQPHLITAENEGQMNKTYENAKILLGDVPEQQIDELSDLFSRL